MVARTVLAVFPLVALWVTGCTSPVAPSAPLAVELGVGASASSGRLTVEFIGVTSDSRCPAAALCIHQGDATVVVRAGVRGATDTYDLRLNDPSARSAEHRGYRITAETLAPYPFTGDPIDPAAYRLTLKIEPQ